MCPVQRRLVAVTIVGIAFVGIAFVVFTWPPVGPAELNGEWSVARELLGSGTVHSYPTGARNAYPLPLELLFLPFGLFGATAVSVLGRALTLILIGAALWTWSPSPRVILPALLSLPALQAILENHLMSAVGLFGLSLAVWAWDRNRWFLCGLAVGLGTIRLVNALPLVVALLFCTSWSKGSLSRWVLGVVSLLAPLTVAAFILDPHWAGEYQANLSVYGVAGVAQVAMRWGTLGELVLLGALCVISVLATRLRAKNGLAIALALSVLGAPMQSPYAAVFALPGLVEVAARPGFLRAAWVVNDAIWLAFIAAVFTHTVFLASAVGLPLLVASYPLVRSSTKQLVRDPAAFQGTTQPF
jgi:hypothetical protein